MPSIELNQNDQTENLEQFSPTTSEINEPTSGSGTRTPLPPNIIDGDPTTTGLEYCENIPPPPSLNIPNVENLEGDLDILNTLRSKYTNNPSIGYLNINSLRGQKFSQLENICKSAKIDILCIDETKLSSEIPTSRIHIDGYQYPPLRRDREQKKANSFGGGKLVYIKEGFICKRISEFETKTSETICIELSLRNKKWFIMFGYRPESIKREIFFEEINFTLSKAVNQYENIFQSVASWTKDKEFIYSTLEAAKVKPWLFNDLMVAIAALPTHLSYGAAIEGMLTNAEGLMTAEHVADVAAAFHSDAGRNLATNAATAMGVMSALKRAGVEPNPAVMMAAMEKAMGDDPLNMDATQWDGQLAAKLTYHASRLHGAASNAGFIANEVRE